MGLCIELSLCDFSPAAEGNPVYEGHAPVIAVCVRSAGLSTSVDVDRNHLAAHLPSNNSVAGLVVGRSATFIFWHCRHQIQVRPSWRLGCEKLAYDQGKN